MSASVTSPGIHRRHFHTFDALRFFAVLKVFLQHLPINTFPWFNYLKAGGYIGVQFFFVLSGFLITYIICSEKEHTGTLNLRNFFARRVLRIWPLFYLIIALCYILPGILNGMGFSLSGAGYHPTLWMSLLFLENYKMIMTHDLPNIFPLAVTWSLCIEEHFYIVWGLLLYFIPVKHLPKLIGFCIVFAVGARIVFVQNGLDPSDLLTHIDLFAYGAIPAYLLVKHEHAVIKWVNSIPKVIQLAYIPLLLLTIVLISQRWDPIINATLFGIMFTFLLMLTLPKDGVIKISGKNILSRFGIYTYGIYLYHLFVIIACNKIFSYFGCSLEDPAYAICYFMVCLALTVLCSYLSYQYFEKPFLKLKRFFRAG